MSSKQEQLRQLVYEDYIEKRFKEMEVPIFTRKRDIALFLFLGIIFASIGILISPFLLGCYFYRELQYRGMIK